MIKILLFWWIVIPLITAILVFMGYILMRMTRAETAAAKSGKIKINFWPQIQKTVRWLWEKAQHPAFFILIGVAMVNWLIWALNNDLWLSLWGNQSSFWALNVTGWIAPSLFLVKGADGKVHPIAKTFAKIMGALALVIFAIGVWKHFGFGGWFDRFLGSDSETIATTQPNHVPAEIALPIICGCESSGVPGQIKHFEDDGVTPLKNKQGSTATGGCQILASDHEKRAEAMGFKIRTPEGNFGFAKVLYNESDPPWKPWEGTPGNTTRGCWMPEILALQGAGVKLPFLLDTVEVPAEGLSRVIRNPRIENAVVDWTPAPEGCEIVVEGQENTKRPCNNASFDRHYKFFQFKSSINKPLEIRLIVRR